MSHHLKTFFLECEIAAATNLDLITADPGEFSKKFPERENQKTDFTDLLPLVCKEWKEIEPIQGEIENQIYTAAGKFRTLLL